MRITSREFFSIPNILTYIRLILIPFFVWTYLIAVQPLDYILPAVLIFLSGFTDVADGFIARRFNMITDWGKFVDPVADKLTQASIAFCLAVRFPWMWALLALFVVKELDMLIEGFVLIRKNKKLDGASWFGKVSTAVFYAVMMVLIAYPPMPQVIANCMMAVSAFFLLLSFILYRREFAKLHRQAREEAAAKAEAE